MQKCIQELIDVYGVGLLETFLRLIESDANDVVAGQILEFLCFWNLTDLDTCD